MFLSEEFPSTSPDCIIPFANGKFGVVEVKYSIEMACKDTTFCLFKKDGQITLNRRHDYYIQITGQLALTSAEFCEYTFVLDSQ